MLKMSGLCKTYIANDIETNALKNIDLHIKKGDYIAITGPSGSGKTTLLNISGLLEGFEKGSYHFDEQEVNGLGDKELSKIRNKKIGFIFQNYNLIPDLSIASNIEAPLRYRNMSAAERKERVENALKKVGLSTRGKHLPSQLSGGQQQRAAIARAIAGDPKIIFADEPTGNLDSNMSEQIMQLLESINKEGCTIVMVTHDNEHAKRARRHVHIVDGSLSIVSES